MKSVAKKSRVLLTLFMSMLRISAFTFGGGYVIVSLMKQRFVDELEWLEEKEMLDITAMAQSMPGAIAVNAAVALGFRMAGPAGVCFAALGTVLPPLIILSVISTIYAAFSTNVYVARAMRGMQAGVAAVITNVVCTMGAKILRSGEAVRIVLMVVAFLMTMLLKVSAVWLIAIGVVVALCVNRASRRKEDQA